MSHRAILSFLSLSDFLILILDIHTIDSGWGPAKYPLVPGKFVTTLTTMSGVDSLQVTKLSVT